MLEDSDEECPPSLSADMTPLVPGHPGSAGQDNSSSQTLTAAVDSTGLNQLPEMGQFIPTLPPLTNGVIMYLNLPSVTDLPGNIRVCNLCDEYLPPNSYLQEVWRAFPSGPSDSPPPGYGFSDARRDSFISDVIGSAQGMDSMTVLFPFSCDTPVHGVHLCCLITKIVSQINRSPSGHMPLRFWTAPFVGLDFKCPSAIILLLTLTPMAFPSSCFRNSTTEEELHQ